MKKAASILLTLAASTALALAAEPTQPPQGGDHPKGPEGHGGKTRPNPEEVFKKLDTNADGNLTEEEFLASPRAQKSPEKAKEHFAKIDKDGNGSVSLEEFTSARPPRKPRGPDGGGAEGGPHGPKPPGEQAPAQQ